MKYIPRHLEPKIKQYVRQFPVVVLTGARQTGKSTLLKHLFQESQWQYVNLDQRGLLARIKSDPDLFVKDIDSNIIIDESQKAPELFHSIKWRIDQGLKYKIILSGSANFHLLQSVTETLAGRAGILELFPFSLREKRKQRGHLLEILLEAKDIKQLTEKIKSIKPVRESSIFEHLLWGGYPKLLEYKNTAYKVNWFENYCTTYIERDLRDLAQVADINDFQRFYQMLAFQAGGILNLSNIANDMGISVPTCKKYLQILNVSYQSFLLYPYHLNIRKRLIKSPKSYIGDTGLGNYLTDNDSMKKMKSSGMFGQIFENGIIAEMIKYNNLLAKKCGMYFWRTSNGAEVDLILEKGGKVIPIEIKSGIEIPSQSIRGLKDFVNLKIKKCVRFGIVIYRGDRLIRLSEKILAVPLGYL